MILKLFIRIGLPLLACFLAYQYLYKNFVSDTDYTEIGSDLNFIRANNRICFDKRTSLKEALNRLKINKVIKSDVSLLLLNKLRGNKPKLIDGCYRIGKGTSSLDLIKALESGQVIMKQFEVKPSYYLDYLDSKLRVHKITKARTDLVTEIKNNKNVYKKQFGIKGDNFEGLIFSKIYELPIYFEASSILRILLNESFNIWNSKFKSQIKSYKLDKNEVLTIASLISNESADISEQKLIAERIIKAIKENKNLNLDSPFNYSLNLQGRKIHKVYRTSHSSYNTYKIMGLPPGPIGAPTEKAVQITIDALKN